MVMPVTWGADSSIYAKALSPLEYELALVAFDPRGVGRSDPARSADEFSQETTAHDAAAVADAVGLQRSVVIGHSSGGGVALTYALLFPERVSHLILIATAARWSDGNTESDVSYPATEAEMREQVRGSLVDSVVHPERFRRGWDELLSKARFSPARFRWTGEVEWERYDVRERLAEVRVPTLIIHGEEDRVIRPQRARELHAGIPGSQLAVFPDCGHWPFVERRDEFVRAVNRFLGIEMRRRSPR